MHHKSKSNFSQDAVYWITLVRAQEKELQFWQTRSHIIIVHDAVPADCMGNVVCQKEYKTKNERLSTPRPAPKIVLKSAWKSRQQRSNPKVTQQITKTPEASGNRCEVLSYLLREKSMNSKLISELKELHMVQYWNFKKRWPKFKNWWTSYELDTMPNRSLPRLGRGENPTGSAQNPEIQFENREILNCMSWE